MSNPESSKSLAERKAVSYDSYDYSKFWLGRDYEDHSDGIAIDSFLKKVPHRGKIIDVGGGLGRVVPHYVNIYKEAVMLEPSIEQLNRTQSEIGHKYPNLSFVQGQAESMPFTDGSADTIICIRVSHYFVDIAVPIAQFHRVLSKDGYLIFDIANKLHFKSRVRSFMKRNAKQIFSAETIQVGKNDLTVFVNHNPKTVKTELQKAGFEIIDIRSVSNLRSALLKKYVPLKVLLMFEKLLQKPLAMFFFGPSIFFLARKK